MTRCKKDDLCVVLWNAEYAEYAEQVVGHFVTTVAVMDNSIPSDPIWEIRPPLRAAIKCANPFCTIDHRIIIYGIADNCLQPIRGVPVSKTETKDQEVTA